MQAKLGTQGGRTHVGQKGQGRIEKIGRIGDRL